MNDRASFLRAIEAEPEDDSVRLVFADWLEDNGDPDRARFIRLQCEYHRAYGRSPTPDTSGRRGELEREIKALLQAHAGEWASGLPAWARAARFERGFPHVFQMTGKQFLDDAAAIRAVSPLPTLFLRLLGGRDAEVLASEHLAGVSWLSLKGAQLSDAGVAALVANPHLSLRRLWVSRNDFCGDSKDANKLTDASAVALAAADNMPALTDLDLGGYGGVTAPALQAILNSEKRANLAALDLSDWPGGPAAAALFRDPAFRPRGLGELRLNNCKLGREGAEVLGQAEALANLRVLWVTQNKLGDRGAATLADSPHLAGLVWLDLWKNALSDKGVRAVLASPHLRAVRRLELGENRRITDASARAVLVHEFSDLAEGRIAGG